MMNPSELDKMGMHESQMIDEDNEVMRVPGGWIYSKVARSLESPEIVAMTSVFVPMVTR